MDQTARDELTLLSTLPVRALAAFAARCARRVRPLFGSHLPGVDAVEYAIVVAERFASGVTVTEDEPPRRLPKPPLGQQTRAPTLPRRLGAHPLRSTPRDSPLTPLPTLLSPDPLPTPPVPPSPRIRPPRFFRSWPALRRGPTLIEQCPEIYGGLSILNSAL